MYARPNYNSTLSLYHEKKTIVVLLFMASLGLFSVLVAGEVYVSPHGSDRNAGTKEASLSYT